ncbi:hypothetical protein [Actinomadura hibisca]|uniref:hypothetical protein n=1 Tax=Actinomadura hibisca TaxID=68565 RepID=UPI00083459D7|nr:hypothetical protein [Actinomadura hibisca]
MTSTASQETVEVEMAGRTVTVPKGGLYDRFRMDTALDEVALAGALTGIRRYRTALIIMCTPPTSSGSGAGRMRRGT